MYEYEYQYLKVPMYVSWLPKLLPFLLYLDFLYATCSFFEFFHGEARKLSLSLKRLVHRMRVCAWVCVCVMAMVPT